MGLQESVAILKKAHTLFKLEKDWNDGGAREKQVGAREELRFGMLSALH